MSAKFLDVPTQAKPLKLGLLTGEKQHYSAARRQLAGVGMAWQAMHNHLTVLQLPLPGSYPLVSLQQGVSTVFTFPSIF